MPTDPAQPVQVIDPRDLGRLVVQLLADDCPGAFHAVGPADPVTLGGLIETCARVPVPRSRSFRCLPKQHRRCSR